MTSSGEPVAGDSNNTPVPVVGVGGTSGSFPLKHELGKGVDEKGWALQWRLISISRGEILHRENDQSVRGSSLHDFR